MTSLETTLLAGLGGLLLGMLVIWFFLWLQSKKIKRKIPSTTDVFPPQVDAGAIIRKEEDRQKNEKESKKAEVRKITRAILKDGGDSESNDTDTEQTVSTKSERRGLVSDGSFEPIDSTGRAIGKAKERNKPNRFDVI